MPSADAIQTYLLAVWRMMITARPDGLRDLDISADGFWASFWAVPLALPPMLVNWLVTAGAFAGDDASRLSVLLRLGISDIAAWLVPLAALAVAARPVGIADRFAHYVIASNWGGLLLVWAMAPPSAVALLLPQAMDTMMALSVMLFVAAMVLSWRLTFAALDKGPGYATGVFAAMMAGSLVALFATQSLLGLEAAAA